MAEHLFFLDTGKEGIHLHRLKDGDYLLQQVNAKGEFHSAVAIPQRLFNTLLQKLLDVKNDGYYKAIEQQAMLEGRNICGKCLGAGKTKAPGAPEEAAVLCTRCNGTGFTDSPGRVANGNPAPDPEPVKPLSYEEMTKEKKG